MKQETPAEKQQREEQERQLDWVEQYGVDTENFARYNKNESCRKIFFYETKRLIRK